jgi:hypothetical protein
MARRAKTLTDKLNRRVLLRVSRGQFMNSAILFRFSDFFTKKRLMALDGNPLRYVGIYTLDLFCGPARQGDIHRPDLLWLPRQGEKSRLAHPSRNQDSNLPHLHKEPESNDTFLRAES